MRKKSSAEELAENAVGVVDEGGAVVVVVVVVVLGVVGKVLAEK